jgi:hypothetical protein
MDSNEGCGVAAPLLVFHKSRQKRYLPQNKNLPLPQITLQQGFLQN